MKNKPIIATGFRLIISGLVAGFLLATPAFALDPARRADSYSVQGWAVEQGLPSSKIRAITETHDGYLWIATAQGMARFDGIHFTVFSRATNPELGGGGFFAVVEAPDGTVWFGGDGGLFCWRAGHFEHFTAKEGLKDSYVRTLFLGRDGTIVVCTRTGFSFIRDGHLTTPGGVWEKVSTGARFYLERTDGSILLGTSDKVWKISGEKIEAYSAADGLAENGFSSLAETSDHSTWIGHGGGLRRVYPDGRTEDYGEAQGLSSQVVALRNDRDGNLWIGTYDGGLYRLAHDRIEAATYREQFGATPIRQIYEDRAGGLWIATATGLFRLKDNISASIGIAQGLTRTSVSAVLEAQDGSWWIGLMSGGVYRFNGTQATPMVLPAKTRLDEITSLAETPTGTVWIGALSGLYRLVGGATTNFYHRDQETAWQKQIKGQPGILLPGLAYRRVSAITPDGDGGIWVATEGALYHGREGGFRAYTKADGLPGNIFKSVIRSRSGDIWATASPEGVACLHEGQWTNYLCGQAISSVLPRIVYEDTAGTIWVTTDGGGINRFKNGHWRIFTTRDGLDDDFISGITEDNLGNLWIACPNGIMRIPLKQFDELDAGKRALLQPRMVNQSDGLPSAEVNQLGTPNAYRTSDGHLLFATDRGVAVIQPADLKINNNLLPMHIERVVVNGADVNLSGPLIIPPGNNDVQIHYTAISLLAAEKVRFKIRLSPLDREWVDTGDRRDVRYAQLPPGNYTFQVTSCNSDGVWNEAGIALNFTVQPHFYQTAWFMMLMALMVGGAGFGIYRVRVLQIRHRTAELERLVKDRTHELRISEALFHSLVEQLPVGVFRKDKEGRYVFLNPWFCRLKGATPEQYLGKTPEECTAAAVAERGENLHDLNRLATRGSQDHQHIMRTGELIKSEEHFPELYGQEQYLHVIKSPVLDAEGTIIGTQGILVDISDIKKAEAKADEAHKQLLDVSRQAGMAEVATSVLHNVGNVLNSINVSTTLIFETLHKSKLSNLGRLAAMIREHQGDLANFFTTDPKGIQLPGYFTSLAEHLTGEQANMIKEVELTRQYVEHVKNIIAMQQSYAKVSGVMEKVMVVDLVEDALRLNGGALVRDDVKVIRDYPGHAIEINVERQKVLQILVNLIRNAKNACDDSGRKDKQLTMQIRNGDSQVQIAVIDNGVGIPAENLTRIFNHGFTTRANGHGFGLHNSALTAKELGGNLNAYSQGPGTGAKFTLELPLQPLQTFK